MPDVGGREDLWRALATLPARQRAALVLRYYEDLSERDTAPVLGCSVAAVKSLVARGGATFEREPGETMNDLEHDLRAVFQEKASMRRSSGTVGRRASARTPSSERGGVAVTAVGAALAR